MEEVGYIKVPRWMRDTPLWPKKRRFTQWEAWTDLLMELRWADQPKVVQVGSTVVKCEKWEVCYSIRTWAERWHCSVSTVVHLLNTCSSVLGYISYLAHPNFVQISLSPALRCDLEDNTCRTLAEHLPNTCRTHAVQKAATTEEEKKEEGKKKRADAKDRIDAAVFFGELIQKFEAFAPLRVNGWAKLYGGWARYRMCVRGRPLTECGVRRDANLMMRVIEAGGTQGTVEEWMGKAMEKKWQGWFWPDRFEVWAQDQKKKKDAAGVKRSAYVPLAERGAGEE